MGFTRAELPSSRDAALPALVGPGVRLRNTHDTVDPLARAVAEPARPARIIA